MQKQDEKEKAKLVADLLRELMLSNERETKFFRENDVGYLTAFKTTFVNQIIAIATLKGNTINLEDVIAYIVVEELVSWLPGHIARKVQRIGQNNEWFVKLLEEIDDEENISEVKSFVDKVNDVAFDEDSVSSEDFDIDNDSEDFILTTYRNTNVPRAGWVFYGADRVLDDIETIAENTILSQFATVITHLAFEYPVNIKKALTMNLIRKFIPKDIPISQKDSDKQIGSNVDEFNKLIEKLQVGYPLEQLYLEYEEGRTPEAKLVTAAKNIVTDDMAWLIEKRQGVSPGWKDLNLNDKVRDVMKPECTWLQMMLWYSRKYFNYDENFSRLSEEIESQ
ncbi:MAG: hypothetical protein K6G36_03205 [Candidatus Saccharibacteria bacterium]|nr:hypothetical protein [Candidatus Saccharibacteria bacterium]